MRIIDDILTHEAGSIDVKEIARRFRRDRERMKPGVLEKMTGLTDAEVAGLDDVSFMTMYDSVKLIGVMKGNRAYINPDGSWNDEYMTLGDPEIL